MADLTEEELVQKAKPAVEGMEVEEKGKIEIVRAKRLEGWC